MPALDGLRLRHLHPRPEADGTLVLILDRADENVNTLSQEVLAELDAVMERLRIEPPTALIIASGKSSGFIAGADIREFRELTDPERVSEALARGHRVFDRLAALPCPTVAAIRGFCMGGERNSRLPAVTVSPPTTRRPESGCPKSGSVSSRAGAEAPGCRI